MNTRFKPQLRVTARWFYDLESRKLIKRYKFDSSWVHDADQIQEDVYVAGLSDKNSISIISIDKMTSLHQYDMVDFGKSVMFVNCCQVNPQWDQVLVPDQTFSFESSSKREKSPNILPNICNFVFWKTSGNVKIRINQDEYKDISLILISDSKLSYEYLFISEDFTLSKGKYRLNAGITCQHGSVSVGVVEAKNQNWLVQFNFDSCLEDNSDDFIIDNEDNDLSVIIAANNTLQEEYIKFIFDSIRLEPLFEISEEESNRIIEKFDAYKAINEFRHRLEERQNSIEKVQQYAAEKEKEIEKLSNEYNKVNMLYEKLNKYAMQKEQEVSKLINLVQKKD